MLLAYLTADVSMRTQRAPHWRPLLPRPETPATCRLEEPSGEANVLKWMVLAAMTLQLVITTALVKFTQNRHKDPEQRYLISSGVLMVQAVKAASCLVLLGLTQPAPLGWMGLLKDLWATTVNDLEATLTVLLVAISYVLMNYMLFIGGKYLSTTAFLVISQLKTFTAAIFAIILAKRHINMIQWASLFVLVGGVTLLQTSVSREEKVKGSQGNAWLGTVSLLGYAVLSGYAGTELELVFKNKPDVSLWARSFQMATIASILAAGGAFGKDYHIIAEKGLLHGFDFWVWVCVVAQAVGGMLIALVLKYADNVVKSFPTALAILCSVYVDALVFNEPLPTGAIIGAMMVVVAIIGYTR